MAIFTMLQSYGQGELKIGGWQAHLPYQQVVAVTQSDDKIIYGTQLSIFSIDKEDLSVSFLSKVDGLSDIGIKRVRFDKENDQLFIIYTNSNVDIIKDDRIINIPNIKSNTSITGNKGVNDIHFVSQSQAFFSTDFGIVEFDPSNYNFGSTTLTSLVIHQMSSLGNIVFAATSEGVYYIDLAVESNLADFGKWQLLGQEQGLPSLYNSMSITRHQGAIYIGTENEIYRSSQEEFSWFSIHEEQGLNLEFITSSDDRLITGWQGNNFENKILFFDDENSFITNSSNCSGVPTDAIRDEQGRIWYTDQFVRIRYAEGYDLPCILTSYNSPFSEKVSDIVVKDDEVLIASGGVAENFTFLFSREGFYYKNENSWQNFNEFDNNEIKQFDLLSVFRVAFHPTLNKIYAGSYWAGLLAYDQDINSYQLYNKDNSSLRGAIGDLQRERVSGLAFDQGENLWVATYNAEEPINVLSNNGQWQSIDVPFSGALTDILLDDQEYKWFPVDGNNGGILIYDSGSSIQSTADDQFRFIRTSNSVLPTNVVLCAAVDLDGAVWVGTNEGPVIFDCGSNVFSDEDCPGVRRKVTQDSIGAFLLADQQINVIAVDGANRKWFGTRNGLFVQSPQGDNQVAHFTTENSPLFDNTITALAFEGATGTMWIGTNRGIISYRTESTEGERIHRKSNVYAFPNPVDPNYRGPIAIKGLVEGANIKITDINGLLVQELTALGGQAIWNGLDAKGKEVASGVYLVFSSDINAFDSPDSFATKIMVLR